MGNKAPLRKKSGRFMKLWMAPKLSRLPIKLAMTRPMLTRPMVMSSMRGRQTRKANGLKLIPKTTAMPKTMIP